MANWQNVLAAATGQAPSHAVVQAERDLTPAERRSAVRAVTRGQAVVDPRAARLAVAIARQRLRRAPGRWAVPFFVVMVLSWAAFPIAQLAGGDLNLAGVVMGAFAVWGVPMIWRIRAAPRNTREAEILNRLVLERAGTPYVEDADAAGPAETAGPVMAMGVLVAWTFYDLFDGAMSVATDGHSLDVGRIVGRGAFFATGMCLSNIFLIRRRTARRSQRPVTSHAPPRDA